MKAMVTGGAGFIGSHVVDALLAQGADVVVLDDLSSGHAENVAPAAELVVGSITDGDLVAEAVDGAELVVHLAAHRAVLRSVEQPVETDRVNIGGTLNVLDAARRTGVRRVVAASSSSVYGGAAEMPTPETAQLIPRSPYAVTKLTGEHYARVFSELYGLETVSLRFFNVYGPRQRPDSRYAAVIPLFIGAVSADQSPDVHGDGEQSRDFTYVSDVAQGVWQAATAPAQVCSGRAYNMSGGARYSLLDVLDELEAQIGNRPPRRHTDPRPGDVRHSEADIAAARRDLVYEPVVGLREGLARTIAWSRDAALAAGAG
jgi:UDP-N-acetylglucosamine/UDP-N-acetyl-alpha-D-glucosaminouronate 4-epimerase